MFAAGCMLALAAFKALGRETRFGSPDGDNRLKTGGFTSEYPPYACGSLFRAF
jgi:hypothetical protein